MSVDSSQERKSDQTDGPSESREIDEARLEAQERRERLAMSTDEQAARVEAEAGEDMDMGASIVHGDELGAGADRSGENPNSRSGERLTPRPEGLSPKIGDGPGADDPPIDKRNVDDLELQGYRSMIDAFPKDLSAEVRGDGSTVYKVMDLSDRERHDDDPDVQLEKILNDERERSAVDSVSKAMVRRADVGVEAGRDLVDNLYKALPKSPEPARTVAVEADSQRKYVEHPKGPEPGDMVMSGVIAAGVFFEGTRRLVRKMLSEKEAASDASH